MNISHKSVLITGANRGIGRALLDEALRRGAKKVYAGTRGALQHADERVTPLTLDVTNGSQIQRAVDEVDTLDVRGVTRSSACCRAPRVPAYTFFAPRRS